MNYLKEILAFYDFKTIYPLSTGQIALWYALLDVNNKCGWIEWFSVSNSTLSNLTGLSRQGINLARKKLKELNLIDIRQNGKKATHYKMLPVSTILQNSLHSSLHTTLHTTLQDSCTLNKQNKTKQNNIYKKSVSKSKFNNYDDANSNCEDWKKIDEIILDKLAES